MAGTQRQEDSGAESQLLSDRTAYLQVVFQQLTRREPGAILDRPAIVPVDEAVILGREELCIHGPDRAISERHAVMERRDGGYRLRDAGSVNGTFVNGRARTDPHRAVALSDGDLVRVGNTLLVFRQDADPPGPDAPWLEPGLPGWSPDVRRARQELIDAARRDLPVLLVGETGTGKEHATRAFHRLAYPDRPAADQTFQAIDATTLQGEPGLIRLFGLSKHEGAPVTRLAREQLDGHQGIIDLARDGTLFVDEIHHLPPDWQPRFLRLFQEREYRRFGGTERRHTNARLVAATNCPALAAGTRDGFQADLRARITEGGTISLPPARERREDLLQWALLVSRDIERAGVAVVSGWDVSAAEAILVHPWTTNFRGLQSALVSGYERSGKDAAALPVLRACHLPERVQATRRRARRAPPPSEDMTTVMPSSVDSDDRPDFQQRLNGLLDHKGLRGG